MTDFDKCECSAASSHTITSDNVLCCAGTGRVVAVFYNDYDLDAVMERIKKSRVPPTKQQLAEKHGTPEVFKRALGNAIAEGSITFVEAVTAIQKYELEYDNAL